MITYDAPTRFGPTAIEISGTSDQTVPVPFRIYRDGVKIADYSSPTQTFRKLVSVPIGESPMFEVLDKAGAIPSPAFPGRVTLNWLAVANAVRYVVEEYYSAVWTERASVRSEGRSAFSWKTRLLETATTHQFRVTPYDAAGNSVSPLTFSFLMVRHSDVPDVDITYSNSTHKLTITAA